MIPAAAKRLLESPAVYRCSQALLAPGAEGRIAAAIRGLLETLPATEDLLDVGCGPASWLRHARRNPVGIDVSPSYMAAYRDAGGRGPVASASQLPFADNGFGGVWSVGLLHHLSDRMASEALAEAVRVCRPGGYVAILDAVLPRQAMLRPIAWTIRRLDRGEFMRTERALHDLLPAANRWATQRITYAATGLELLICTSTKP